MDAMDPALPTFQPRARRAAALFALLAVSALSCSGAQKPAPDDNVVALASDANGVYVAGAGTGGNFAAFNPSTGSMTWQGGTNGNVQAITVLNGEVYAGGHYTTYCGPQGGQHTCTNPIARSKILAVDETTGALQSWAPSVNSALGVFALDGGAGYLELGGDFTKVAGTAQQGFAAFSQ